MFFFMKDFCLDMNVTPVSAKARRFSLGWNSQRKRLAYCKDGLYKKKKDKGDEQKGKKKMSGSTFRRKRQRSLLHF